MTGHVKDAGTWKTCDEIHVKDGGVWKEVQNAYVRDAGVWKEFHTAEVLVTLSSTTNVNMQSLFSTSDWTSSKKKRVLVPAGVTIGATSTAAAAIISGTGWGGTLTLEVLGTVSGAGGAASSGVGNVGGDAINAQASGLIVTGTGTIRAGGGSGGKGGTGGSGQYLSNTYGYDGSGTYWRNADGTAASAPNTTKIFWSNVEQYSTTYNAGLTQVSANGYLWTRDALQFSGGGTWFYALYRGSYIATSGGAGGNGGRGQGYGGANQAGAAGSAGGTNAGTGGTGGTGGTWGASGNTGATGSSGNVSAGTAGSAGGAAGWSIRNPANANATGFTGTRQGRTS